MSPRLVTLGEVCQVRSSLVDPSQPENRNEPHVAPDNIERDTGRLLGYRTVAEDRVMSGKYRFEAGDLLYSKIRPNLNKAVLVDFSGLCSADMYALNLDQEQVVPQYVAHLLRSQGFLDFATSLSNRANIPKLNRSQLLGFVFLLPPLKEQKRIAAMLDQADALRAKRSQAHAHLDELEAALFLEMFGDPGTNTRGWKVATLGSLATRFSDGPFGSNLKSSHYVADGMRVVRLQNIGVGNFIDRDRAYISEEHFGQLRRHRCVPGDVLIATLGDPNLRACIQPGWLTEALNKADCVQMRVDPTSAVPAYIAALLNMPGTIRLADSLMAGQTRTRISMGRLRGLHVPVPPLGAQEEFSRTIEAAGAVRNLALTAADHEESLFMALQAQAFSETL